MDCKPFDTLDLNIYYDQIYMFLSNYFSVSPKSNIDLSNICFLFKLKFHLRDPKESNRKHLELIVLVKWPNRKLAYSIQNWHTKISSLPVYTNDKDTEKERRN